MARKVGKCSGGEQQRLRFALALLLDPQLLILAEAWLLSTADTPAPATAR